MSDGVVTEIEALHAEFRAPVIAFLRKQRDLALGNQRSFDGFIEDVIKMARPIATSGFTANNNKSSDPLASTMILDIDDIVDRSPRQDPFDKTIQISDAELPETAIESSLSFDSVVTDDGHRMSRPDSAPTEDDARIRTPKCSSPNNGPRMASPGSVSTNDGLTVGVLDSAPTEVGQRTSKSDSSVSSNRFVMISLFSPRKTRSKANRANSSHIPVNNLINKGREKSGVLKQRARPVSRKTAKRETEVLETPVVADSCEMFSKSDAAEAHSVVPGTVDSSSCFDNDNQKSDPTALANRNIYVIEAMGNVPAKRKRVRAQEQIALSDDDVTDVTRTKTAVADNETQAISSICGRGKARSLVTVTSEDLVILPQDMIEEVAGQISNESYLVEKEAPALSSRSKRKCRRRPPDVEYLYNEDTRSKENADLPIATASTSASKTKRGKARQRAAAVGKGVADDGGLVAAAASDEVIATTCVSKSANADDPVGKVQNSIVAVDDIGSLTSALLLKLEREGAPQSPVVSLCDKATDGSMKATQETDRAIIAKRSRNVIEPVAVATARPKRGRVQPDITTLEPITAAPIVTGANRVKPAVLDDELVATRANISDEPSEKARSIVDMCSNDSLLHQSLIDSIPDAVPSKEHVIPVCAPPVSSRMKRKCRQRRSPAVEPSRDVEMHLNEDAESQEALAPIHSLSPKTKRGKIRQTAATNGKIACDTIDDNLLASSASKNVLPIMCSMEPDNVSLVGKAQNEFIDESLPVNVASSSNFQHDSTGSSALVPANISKEAAQQTIRTNVAKINRNVKRTFPRVQSQIAIPEESLAGPINQDEGGHKPAAINLVPDPSVAHYHGTCKKARSLIDLLAEDLTLPQDVDPTEISTLVFTASSLLSPPTPTCSERLSPVVPTPEHAVVNLEDKEALDSAAKSTLSLSPKQGETPQTAECDGEHIPSEDKSGGSVPTALKKSALTSTQGSSCNDQFAKPKSEAVLATTRADIESEMSSGLTGNLLGVSTIDNDAATMPVVLASNACGEGESHIFSFPDEIPPRSMSCTVDKVSATSLQSNTSTMNISVSENETPVTPVSKIVNNTFVTNTVSEILHSPLEEKNSPFSPALNGDEDNRCGPLPMEFSFERFRTDPFISVAPLTPSAPPTRIDTLSSSLTMRPLLRTPSTTLVSAPGNSVLQSLLQKARSRPAGNSNSSASVRVRPSALCDAPAVLDNAQAKSELLSSTEDIATIPAASSLSSTIEGMTAKSTTTILPSATEKLTSSPQPSTMCAKDSSSEQIVVEQLANVSQSNIAILASQSAQKFVTPKNSKVIPNAPVNLSVVGQPEIATPATPDASCGQPIVEVVTSVCAGIEVFSSDTATIGSETPPTVSSPKPVSAVKQAINPVQPEKASTSVWDSLFSTFSNISTGMSSFVKAKDPADSKVPAKRAVDVRALKQAALKKKRDEQREEELRERSKKYQEAAELRKKKAALVATTSAGNPPNIGLGEQGNLSTSTTSRPPLGELSTETRRADMTTAERLRRAEDNRQALEAVEVSKRVEKEERQKQRELFQKRQREEDMSKKQQLKRPVDSQKARLIAIPKPESSVAAGAAPSSSRLIPPPGKKPAHKFAMPTPPAVIRHVAILPSKHPPSSPASPEPTVQIPTSPPKSDSESDDEDTANKKKALNRIPKWAQTSNLMASLISQSSVDPDSIFTADFSKTCDLSELFLDFSSKTRFTRRTSSGNWMQDRLGWKEELEYKRRNGFL